MSNSFINRKDRIVASAVEIISEAGIMSLTTKTLAMKENMSESLLYRYFGGIEEVLVEVVSNFVKFDEGIFATYEAKEIPHIDKVVEVLSLFGTYYSSYEELGAVVLNYEVFLHNVNTRDMMTKCIGQRTQFVQRELAAAMKEGEICNLFTPEELTNILIGSLDRDLLNRRIEYGQQSHTEAAKSVLEKMVKMLRIEK